MPHPKIKISDDSGNTVDVTESNELKVKLSDSVTVTATDLSVQLDHTNDSVQLWGNESAAGSGTARALLTDDAGHLQIDVITAPSTAVTGTFWQTTQPVSGTVTANAGTGTLAVSNTALDELGTAINASDQVDVNIASGGFDGAVTGTFWQATQPVSIANFLTREDSGHSTAEYGVTAMTVRNDVLGSSGTSTDEDYSVLKTDEKGALYTTHGITGGADDVTTDDTSGTVLGGDVTCKKIDIQAQTDNTGVVAVGFTGVDATIATGTGILLSAGDIYSLEINNLNLIYIEASVSGEGVRYTYFT